MTGCQPQQTTYTKKYMEVPEDGQQPTNQMMKIFGTSSLKNLQTPLRIQLQQNMLTLN